MNITLSTGREGTFRRQIGDAVLTFARNTVTELTKEQLEKVYDDIGHALFVSDEHGKPDNAATNDLVLEVAGAKVEAAEKLKVAADLTPAQQFALKTLANNVEADASGAPKPETKPEPDKNLDFREIEIGKVAGIEPTDVTLLTGAGLKTVGNVLDFAHSPGLKTIPNLGEVTETKILDAINAVVPK